MNVFKENYCRICMQFFCCSTCRSKHERNYHDVNPECEICIYGKMVLRKISSNLLEHVQYQHMPLHCLFCKKVFLSVEELSVKCKCLKMLDQTEQVISIATPTTLIDLNYDSPPMYKSILISSNKHLGNNTLHVTTSTPMQNTDELKSLSNIPEEITPVDYSKNVFNTNNKSKPSHLNEFGKALVDSEHLQIGEQLLKRRVTFSDSLHTLSPDDNLILKQKELSEDICGNKCKVINMSVSKKQSNRYESLDSTTWETAVMEINLTQSQIPAPIMEHSEMMSPILVPNFENSNILPPNNESKNPSEIEFYTRKDLNLTKESHSFNSNILPHNMTRIYRTRSDSQKSGIVSLLISIVRTVLPSFSGSKSSDHIYNSTNSQCELSFLERSHSYKRLKPETENTEEIPAVKKIKLTDIRCRRAIHNIEPVYQVKYKRRKCKCIDKSSQTDS